MFGILKDLNHHKRDGAIPGKFHFYEKEKKMMARSFGDSERTRFFIISNTFFNKQL